jgi:hypothetical protein
MAPARLPLPNYTASLLPLQRAEKSEASLSKKSSVRLVSLDQITPEYVKWLWPGRVPLGKITILQGDPGLGKSTLALDIAGRTSKNLPMPDHSLGDVHEAANILLLSAEDCVADTIRPRLDALGADQHRISIPEDHRHFLVPTDADLIREAVRSINAKLLIIDPLTAFLDGAINSWNNRHVRRALMPLSAIAGELGVAILIVDHLNKRSGVAAIQRGSGSIGFNAAARSVLLASKHPQESETFVLASVKSNLGPPPSSLGYRTVEAANKAVTLEWLGECPYEADDLVTAAFESANSRKLGMAMDLLNTKLSGTSALSKVVDREAAALGISSRTLARARNRLGVIAKPVGMQGEWVLSLPLREPAILSG